MVSTTKIRLEKWAYQPTKGHFADAGIDLRTPEKVVVPKHGSALIDTGVMAEIPLGFYGKLESKSGLNVKHDVVSCGGVIDAGYTGHINVKLYNFGDKDFVFEPGDKIVQMIIIPCSMDFHGVQILDSKERGDNGFGSTGK